MFGVGGVVGVVVTIVWHHAEMGYEPIIHIAAPPPGRWVDLSRDGNPLAALYTPDHPRPDVRLTVGCVRADEDDVYPPKLGFEFDGLVPEEYADRGAASRVRWGFIADDVIYEQKHPRPPVTADVLDGLITADQLIVEEHRVFDLGEDDMTAVEESSEGWR